MLMLCVLDASPGAAVLKRCYYLALALYLCHGLTASAIDDWGVMVRQAVWAANADDGRPRRITRCCSTEEMLLSRSGIIPWLDRLCHR